MPKKKGSVHFEDLPALCPALYAISCALQVASVLCSYCAMLLCLNR